MKSQTLTDLKIQQFYTIYCISLNEIAYLCLLAIYFMNHWKDYNETTVLESYHWMDIYNQLALGVCRIQDGRHSWSSLANTKVARTQLTL